MSLFYELILEPFILLFLFIGIGLHWLWISYLFPILKFMVAFAIVTILIHALNEEVE